MEHDCLSLINLMVGKLGVIDGMSVGPSLKKCHAVLYPFTS